MRGKPSAARVREVLDYDPATGILRWRVKTNKSRNEIGKVAGCQDGAGYILIGLDYQHIRAHILAWVWMTGEWPTQEIDHRNRVKSDNHWANLRQVTTPVNGHNTVKARSTSLSGLLGVNTRFVNGERVYASRIYAHGRMIFLGQYHLPELAHDAYVLAKKLYHPGASL